MIDKVTSLSGDLHHSVMMAKQFLIEVMIITLYGLIFMFLLIKGQWLFIYTYMYILFKSLWRMFFEDGMGVTLLTAPFWIIYTIRPKVFDLWFFESWIAESFRLHLVLNVFYFFLTEKDTWCNWPLNLCTINTVEHHGDYDWRPYRHCGWLKLMYLNMGYTRGSKTINLKIEKICFTMGNSRFAIICVSYVDLSVLFPFAIARGIIFLSFCLMQ